MATELVIQKIMFLVVSKLIVLMLVHGPLFSNLFSAILGASHGDIVSEIHVFAYFPLSK